MQQLSAYQHSFHIPLYCLPISHTHTNTHQHNTSITELPHTLHINSGCRFLHVSCIITQHTLCFPKSQPGNEFYKAAKHTHTSASTPTHTHIEKKPKHPEETKWGQTSVQPETHTHTHFLREQYYCFNSAAPTTGHWNWEFQNQWEQCYQNTLHGTQNNAGYSCSRARNIIKPLIKVCRAAPIGTQRVLSQEADGETTRGE